MLGPERLPGAVRTLAHWIRALRSTIHAIKTEISQELQLDDLKRDFDPEQLHDDLHAAEQKDMQDLTPQQQASVEQLRRAAAEVQRPYAAPPRAGGDGGSADAPVPPAEKPSYNFV